MTATAFFRVFHGVFGFWACIKEYESFPPGETKKAALKSLFAEYIRMSIGKYFHVIRLEISFSGKYFHLIDLLLLITILFSI